MVSNSLNMELRKLLALLDAMRNEWAGDTEYRELRGHLPEEWPL